MRSSLTLLVAAGARLGACTNDFDALLDQGTGGATTSTGDAASGSPDASSSSGSSAETSTATAASASSSSSSGVGPGSGGGGGGPPGTGGSGTGGEEASPPCEEIQIDLTGGSPGWNAETDRATIDIDNGTMRVDLQADEPEASGYLVRDVDAGDFDHCSVTTSVLALPEAVPPTIDVGGVLLLLDGTKPLAGVSVASIHDPPGPTKTVYGLLFHDGVDFGYRGERVELDAAPPIELRMRNTDDHIAFEVRGGGDWIAVGEVAHDELAGEIDAVVVGAALENAGAPEDTFNVTLGPVNP